MLAMPHMSAPCNIGRYHADTASPNSSFRVLTYAQGIRRDFIKQGNGDQIYKNDGQDMLPSSELYSDPNGVIEVLIDELGFDDDEKFANALGLPVKTVDQLRRKAIKLEPRLLLQMLEISDFSTSELRNLVVARRTRYH